MADLAKTTKEKKLLHSYSYDVCIVGGVGRVGLPLGIALAQEGKRVSLYDINRDAIDTVSQGKMPFREEGAEKALKSVLGKNLFVTPDISVIKDSSFIIIVIGTPVDEHLNPKFTLFKDFFAEIMPFIKDEHHIILRSTVYPGTTLKIKEFLRANGKHTRISYCPERIAEGKALEELKCLPQIVASFDELSYQEAKDLFSSLTNDIIFLEPTEAELAKLYTNVWRYIQFSIANQFYTIATNNGLDYHKIFTALKHNYPRVKGLPGPGFAAGPCLLKDTMQLAAYSNNTFFLGHAAMLVNEGLPNFIVQALKNRYPLHEKTVGILGMAFKADCDDIRESLSYKLRKLLEIESKKVLCADPIVQEEGLVTTDKLIADSDILILGAPHQAFRDLEIDFSSKVVIDPWNFFGKGDGLQ